MRNLLLYLLLAFPLGLGAQNIAVLDEQSFFEKVLQNHPIAQQAEWQKEQAQLEVLKAKGAFDPYLFSENSQKQFKDKEYYYLSESGVKLPTRLGVSFEAGYDWNNGTYLNPENTVPATGLWYAGIKVPLLQGMFIDENRAGLQEAQITRQSGVLEQKLMQNELLLNASQSYWQWVAYGKKAAIYAQYVDLYRVRYQATLESVKQGDKPAVDTLESFTQWRSLQLQARQYQMQYQKYTQWLHQYLWESPQMPDAESYALPDTLSASPVSNLAPSQDIIAAHPEVQLYNNKLKTLNIEQRWKREKLKPKLALKYNFLTAHASPNNGWGAFDENYKIGLSFGFPLMLRSERAAVKQGALKIESTESQLENKQNQLSTKLSAYSQALEQLKAQLDIARDNIRYNEQLVKAEKRKFEIGESSLYFVNSREMNLLKAQTQWIDLMAQYHMTENEWYYAQGTLNKKYEN